MGGVERLVSPAHDGGYTEGGQWGGGGSALEVPEGWFLLGLVGSKPAQEGGWAGRVAVVIVIVIIVYKPARLPVPSVVVVVVFLLVDVLLVLVEVHDPTGWSSVGTREDTVDLKGERGKEEKDFETEGNR